MDVFDITAESKEEVLALVAQELGNDAIILDLREDQVVMEYGEVISHWVATAAKAREIMRMEQEIVQETRRKAAQGLLTFKMPRSFGQMTPEEQPVKDLASKDAPKDLAHRDTAIEESLASLKSKLNNVMTEEKTVYDSSLPALKLTPIIESDVKPVSQAKQSGRPSQLSQPAINCEQLVYASPLELTEGQPLIEVFVGTCGAGKSTTLAKLASKAHLNGQSVAVITLDTYRNCASELLQAYTDVMGIPCLPVSEKSELSRVLLELKESHDLILIDTAGVGPRDQDRMNHLNQMLEELHPDRTHLVMPGDLHPVLQRSLHRRYSALHLTHLTMTRLDEAAENPDGLHELCQFAHDAQLPLSYLSFGQQVPEDISVATAAVLRTQMTMAEAQAAALSDSETVLAAA